MKLKREKQKIMFQQNPQSNSRDFKGSNPPPLEKMRLDHLRWIWSYVKEHWKIGVIGAIGMIVLSLLSLPAPYLTKIVIDQAIGGRNVHLLNLIILALIGIQLLLFGASWVTNYSFNRFSLEIITRMKKDLYYRILRFPMSFFAQYQTGYIMSRIGEIEGLNLFFSMTLVQVAISFFRFIFCLGIMFHLNVKLTAISLCFLPLLFWITKRSTKELRRISWQYYEKSAVISQGMQDSLSGIEVIKSYGGETREAEKFHLRLNDIKSMNLRRTVLVSFYSESVSFLGAGIGFVILWWSGWKIISGQFTLGSYLAFVAYFTQLFGPTQMLANLGLTLQPARVALQRIRELLKVIAEDEPGKFRTISSLKGRISLQGIDFEYEAGKPVFSKASLEIGVGEKILIVGPNGSGKSTLIKLIMGFYQPQGGKILFDGQPLNEISTVSLREHISVVSQSTFLFSDTIRNNILYSAPEATDEELKEALRLSGAMEFVCAMPQALDTEVGERGIRLSGGERQKLSIARAILRKSDLIIFDEATTHLDNASIRLLRDMMKNRFADKTCLVISHRPIEIPVIDHIYLIERGGLQELDSLHVSG